MGKKNLLQTYLILSGNFNTGYCYYYEAYLPYSELIPHLGLKTLGSE